MQRWIVRALAAAVVLVAALYFVRAGNNPRGYHIDESSISYNAYTISKSGSDESGNPWPLYFRAFGDYKNPTYIYLLAGLFRLTGPSILVARMLSATAGALTGIVLGLLALRLSGKPMVALVTAISALLTPWLFETSRIVLELAFYPLLLGLFLLSLFRASRKERWSLLDVTALAVTLALLTYTYSIGRLFGPLLAAGLLLVCTRMTWRSVVQTWVAYGITLIPLLIYIDTHPGTLTARFNAVAYLDPDAGVAQTALAFSEHYFGNWNPWRLLLTGDPNRHQVAHLFGAEHFLAATFVLSLVGVWIIAREKLRDRSWRFVLYALAIAPVPASLTTDYSHMLRLIPLPVMLLVVAIPAFDRLSAEHPKWLLATIALVVAQGAIFQWRFHVAAPTKWRLHLYDAEYRTRIFDRAVASGMRPIYLADLPVIPGYIQAYWYATLDGVDREQFVRLAADEAPPAGGLVITTEEHCFDCDVLDRVEPYMLYVAHAAPRPRAPLPEEAFRAELKVLARPGTLRPRESALVRVRVKNTSPVTWSARERSAGNLQVSLGNHWLEPTGAVVANDDGRAALTSDLNPGEETELLLTINAPGRRGDYILELDMLQEGVSWFASKGAATTRFEVRVD